MSVISVSLIIFITGVVLGMLIPLSGWTSRKLDQISNEPPTKLNMTRFMMIAFGPIIIVVVASIIAFIVIPIIFNG